MKTQLLTLAFAMMIFSNVLLAKSSKLHATPDQVSVNVLLDETAFEASLDLKEWMTNDEQWSKNAELPVLDTVVDEEAALEIEPWMTDNKLWEPKRSVVYSNNSITINGIVYKIYDYNNDREPALNIEAWMVNDKMWKRYKFENTFASHQ
ncbi:MAG: hypothetical protein JXR22_09840 [Prolixibacteraceae bacterium]|nr:hypothetical protein [Prolixibacteraceae bacterium]